MAAHVFANQKGGVGKSTMSVHKAYQHAEEGKKVLFIDFDGQGNSSKSLKKSEKCQCIFDASLLFGDEPLPEVDIQEGIYLISGTAALDEVERMSNNVVYRPKEKLEDIMKQFDYCIMDTPPTLGLRLISALIIADFVVCPFELSTYSTDGIERLIQTIEGVRRNLNPDLVFLGMLPNRVNSRSTRHKESVKTLYRKFADFIIKQPVVLRDSVEEANDEGVPVWKLGRSGAKAAGKEMKSALDKIVELSKEKI